MCSLVRCLGIRRQSNLAKYRAKLKCRISHVVHVAPHVETPQKLMSQNQRHWRVTMCEVLHWLCDARRYGMVIDINHHEVRAYKTRLNLAIMAMYVTSCNYAAIELVRCIAFALSRILSLAIPP